MADVKVTVVKRTVNEDLAAQYAQPGTGICTAFEDGQEFVVDGLNQPEGFCAWAWGDIHKSVLAIRSGSNFGFMQEEGTLVVACTDGIRPVIFKVERIDD